MWGFNKLMLVGIVLVALGVAALVVSVIPFHHTEQVAKVGSFVATRDTETDYVIPSYVGIIAVAAGVALVIMGARKRR